MIELLKRIPIGTNSFSKLVQGDYYFVDKTLLMKEFLDKGSDVTLVTRPRRFGKTINMSMLSEFFDITKDSKKLFVGTKIMETPYASEMNQYPVIYMTFANAKRDKQSVIETIKKQILDEWDRYEFVFENLGKHEQSDYDNFEEVLMNKRSATLEGINDTIAFLMERLKAYYGKDVMVFIDEYDTPFIEAHVNGFYDDVRGGLAGLLHNSLKNSPCLKYAFMTGIQRIAKENIFSDLNNLKVCTVANEEYAPYFGFDLEETKEILEYYGLELTDEVKLMYDGYKIGNQEIYNPWSIMNYARRKKLESYWVNTSAVTMIRKALENLKDNTMFKKQYEKLIQNGKCEMNVVLNSSFYENANIETLWGLFVNAGYLTIDEKIDENDFILRIPNKEVRKDFIRITEYYLSLNQG